MAVLRGSRSTSAVSTIATLLPETDGPYRLLALGAHADDIEIGAGGTLLRLLSERPGLRVDVAVLTGDEVRHREAQESARALIQGRFGEIGIRLIDLRDGYLPMSGARSKEEVERLKGGGPYHLVVCPSLGDAHQDHRHVAELAWQTFRSTTILEYEIPKYEGIGEKANLYVELTREQCERKVIHLMDSFPSQIDHSWFTAETFWALLRLRGVESSSPTGYAEAFICRKLRI